MTAFSADTVWHGAVPRHLGPLLPVDDQRFLTALVVEHGVAFDERRAAAVGALYTTEGVLHVDTRTLIGRDALNRHGANRDADLNRTTRHLVSNIRLFGLGSAPFDRAGAISTAVIFEHFSDRQSTPAPGLLVDYHDHFERQADGNWLFAARAVHRLGH